MRVVVLVCLCLALVGCAGIQKLGDSVVCKLCVAYCLPAPCPNVVKED